MSNLPTQEDIDAIDAEIRETREALIRLEQRKHEMMIAAWNVEKGSVVRETKGKGRIGTVKTIRNPWKINHDRPWVRVYLHKKDGTPGNQTSWFFADWELV